MSRELRKYEIRATKRPAKNSLLSSTVIVRNEQGEVGYCYVNFSRALVERVGFLLPRGLTEDDSAFLQVVYYPRTAVWLVIASYLTKEHETLLWKTKDKPSWLNFYRYKHHASDSPPPRRKSSADPNADPTDRPRETGGASQAGNDPDQSGASPPARRSRGPRAQR